MRKQTGNEWTGQGGGCDECVWVHPYLVHYAHTVRWQMKRGWRERRSTCVRAGPRVGPGRSTRRVSEQPGNEWPLTRRGGGCLCTGTPVHYAHTTQSGASWDGDAVNGVAPARACRRPRAPAPAVCAHTRARVGRDAIVQGLTLAHFRAQFEDLREYIGHVRAQPEHLWYTSWVQSDHMGDTVSLS